jgi:hypothetical protein|tara:strand:+ start:86 stop:298 length:213 start_codon:yes stop_codon:yes gene_type:complete
MTSKEKAIIDEISNVVENLSQKIENFQVKIEKLCKSTGSCNRIKTVHKDLLSSKKEEKNGTDIDTLCKKE